MEYEMCTSGVLSRPCIMKLVGASLSLCPFQSLFFFFGYGFEKSREHFGV